jgi:hypothetical protein
MLDTAAVSTAKERGGVHIGSARQPLIATRASVETKQRFAALAASRGLTESALLMLLIDTVLGSNAAGEQVESAARPCAGDRMSLRLRPGDRSRLEARAAARGLKPSSYVAMLVRAHVRRQALLPLPAELHALKAAVVQLTALGRGLGGSAGDGVTHESMSQTAAAVAALRREFAEFVRRNLQSWETDDD